MNKNLIATLILASLSASVSADYIVRAPLKNTYNFFPDVEHTYGDWINIGEPDSCKDWTPLDTTVLFGAEFEQQRDCEQYQQRTVTVTHTNPDTGESINGESYVEFGTSVVKEDQNSIGRLVKFKVNTPKSLEFQNNESANVTAESHSAKEVIWEASKNLTLSGSGNSASLVAKDEKDGWVRYRLSDGADLQSEWSTNYPINVVNDYVDTRHLVGTKYNGSSKAIGVSQIHSNFTFETWVKPSKSIKEGSVASSLGVDGTSGENYLFYPSHGYDTNNHGMGISVGVNGVKIHVHSTNYMPSLFVKYTPVSSSAWTHFAVSVRNNIATVYKNGVAIGNALPPSHGAVLSPTTIGDGSSYGAFHGRLAESRVWNKPLGSAEIKNLYLRHLTSHKTSSGASLMGVVK